jgi:hypothetical protein
MISAMITEDFARRAPVTYSFLLDSPLYFFGTGLLQDTLRHISRTLPGVKTIAAVLMEAERVAVNEATIAAFCDKLEGMIEDAPAAMIFNIDESGYSEWAGAHKVRVLVRIHIRDRRSRFQSTWTANVRRESGLGVGKVPRCWMLVKEETGGYDSRHRKTHTTLISFLLTMIS